MTASGRLTIIASSAFAIVVATLPAHARGDIMTFLFGSHRPHARHHRHHVTRPHVVRQVHPAAAEPSTRTNDDPSYDVERLQTIRNNLMKLQKELKDAPARHP